MQVELKSLKKYSSGTKPSISLCTVLTLAPIPFVPMAPIGIKFQQNPKNKMSCTTISFTFSSLSAIIIIIMLNLAIHPTSLPLDKRKLRDSNILRLLE